MMLYAKGVRERESMSTYWECLFVGEPWLELQCSRSCATPAIVLRAAAVIKSLRPNFALNLCAQTYLRVRRFVSQIKSNFLLYRRNQPEIF